MTVAIVSEHLASSAVVESRAACHDLGLEVVEWEPGRLATMPRVVIAGLPSGQRRVPAELVSLLEASSSVRLILCTHEVLVRPRYPVGDGRVCLLGPPVERAQVIAALHIHLGTSRDPEPPSPGRFEMLRRTHWVAWSQAGQSAAISMHDYGGTTLVVGDVSADERDALAGAITTSAVEHWRAPPGVGIAHLREEATEWVLSWPVTAGALWMCSPHRVPVRWNAAQNGKRELVCLPAFPSDQLVGVWSPRLLSVDPLAQRGAMVLESGVETFANVEQIARERGDVTGLVMEVR